MPDYLRLKRETLELDQDRFYYELDFDQKKDILDKIVQDEIHDYYIRELGYKKAEDVYLSEEDMVKLISKITAVIFVKRMTPAVLANMSYYYNFASDKELQKIIADRVSIAVLDLSLKTNSPILEL